MKSIHGMMNGPAMFECDTKMYGMVVGDITIASGVRAELYGTITGQLTVEAGADVKIFGMVVGGIFDKGGRICCMHATSDGTH